MPNLGRAVDVFDLIQAPERIRPDLGPFALMIFLGMALASLGSIILWFTRPNPAGLSELLRFTSGASRWPRRLGWFLAFIGAGWTGVASAGLYQGLRDAGVARKAATDGRYLTLEGCLDEFEPGARVVGRAGSGYERWRIGGQEFRYGAGQFGYAYEKVEPLGGIVHAESRVHVAYVLNGDEADILRLEVIQHACPAAPVKVAS